MNHSAASGLLHAARAQLQPPRFWLLALMLSCMAVLSACGGGGGGGSFGFVGLGSSGQIGNPPGPATQPPAGLSYAMTSAVYEFGQPIVPNQPSASGDAVTRYSVEPPLPAGLVLDVATGVISGTPTAVTPSTIYVVTAENAAGSTTARVEIEVRQTPALPAGLSYRETTVVYTVGEAIAPNAPSSSGGPIASYTVAPALPVGLAFDAKTGVISGTPTAVTAQAPYTVTGTNAAGSVTVTLQLEVQPALVAPASVIYSTPTVLYVATEAIVPNTAQTTGGPVASFTVAPSLPAGLSLNAQTGAITGTPAALQSLATYTVTASNAAGSAQTQVRIAITARGSWVSTATVPGARHYFELTRLPNGKVLVSGGFTDTGVTNSAALYDPATGTWSAAAAMLYARNGHSATVLSDGRVLVAGGSDSARVGVLGAEIYDPATDTWTATGSMAEARDWHSAALLPNGKVLVVGGYSSQPSLTFSQTAELYDPATGVWATAATPLATARGQHAMELLPGGNAVLVIGGVNRQGFVNTAEVFAVDGSATTSMSISITGNLFRSALLADGSVLALADGSTTALRFHPATSTWTTSTFSATRSLPILTALADGRVLLAGGSSLNTAEVFNPDFDVWTTAGSMATARRAASAVLLNDGRVLAVSGFSNADGEVDASEIYLP
jgi:hypothetical protein